MKRANEAGRPGEEFVEPRAGAEENAEQNGTPRTPSRQGASHGLDRVRQAVRFAVKYPRWEPDALVGPVRFCAGGAQQWASLPRSCIFMQLSADETIWTAHRQPRSLARRLIQIIARMRFLTVL